MHFVSEYPIAECWENKKHDELCRGGSQIWGASERALKQNRRHTLKSVFIPRRDQGPIGAEYAENSRRLADYGIHFATPT